MEKVKIIFNVASSIIGVTEETVERIDIQECKLSNAHWYAGYLYTNHSVYLIREDGTFELRVKEV